MERYVGELARWLAGRGHDVTLLTTAPDRSRLERGPGGAVTRYVRSGRALGRGRWQVDPLTRTVPSLARAVPGLGRFDIVEAHHFPDAAALRLSSPRGRYSVWLPGVPRKVAVGHRPLARWTALFGLAGASALTALSRHAAAVLRDEFGMDARVLSPGVDTSLYRGPKPVAEGDLILCTASPDDLRKKVDVLVRAFVEVGARLPRATLLLAPPSAPAARDLVARHGGVVRDRIIVHVPSGSEELARLYREATVSVLPSVDEAFGLVLVESLAAGTPVVGTIDGAVPEVVDSEAIGRLARPDDPASLAQAIVETVGLSRDPGTSEACRAAAARWDWDVVGPLWERLHGIPSA